MTQLAVGKRRRLRVVDADGVIDRGPAADPDDGAGDALAVVEHLNRSGRVLRIAAEDNLTAPASRPFWADLVRDPDRASTPASPPSRSALDSTALNAPDAVSPDTDLIITTLRPEHRTDRTAEHASDLVALVAARLLRVGGILAVLTHCDWPQGELIDLTGAVVASAQNADLLYLQHIVALHAPVRGGRFAAEALTNSDSAVGTAPDSTTAERQARATHYAAVRGLPAPHRRIHSDVLVFAQPHEHDNGDGPLPVSLAEQALENGVIR